MVRELVKRIILGEGRKLTLVMADGEENDFTASADLLTVVDEAGEEVVTLE